MTKVLFIAYYFPPTGGAGVQRALKFVQYLPPEGFLPVVITGPSSPDSRWTPHDQSLVSSVPECVPVHRIGGSVPDEGSRFRRRMRRWLAQPKEFSHWWIRSATELAAAVAGDEALIFATMSPFESGEIASELSKRLHLPWVADLRDPWALDEMAIYPTALHRRQEMLKMERVLSTASLIIMNTPEAAAALGSALPRLRNRRIISIPNGFDSSDFAFPVAARRDGKFRIVHTGYLHTDSGARLRKRMFYRLLGGVHPGVDILTRSHTVLLEAMARCCERNPEMRSTAEIVLAGNLSPEDEAVVSASAVADLVRRPGYLSHTESVRLVRTADLLFLPMHNLPPGRRCRIVPGKTYEYMASGRPILAAVPDGDARDFLECCGTASICRPNDIAAMVALLERAYSAWKNQEPAPASDQTFVRQFERRALTHRLASAFASVLESASLAAVARSLTSYQTIA